MSEPWNLTEPQRRQFREAQAAARAARPPSKRWRVRTASECEDRRSQSAAYELANALTRQLLHVTVEHWEDGRWRTYEHLDPRSD